MAPKVKKKKHKLGSVVEQIMRKRRAEESGSRPTTKHGSGSNKVSANYQLTLNSHTNCLF